MTAETERVAAAALQAALTLLRRERDVIVDSVTDVDGAVVDELDGEELAEFDRVISLCETALSREQRRYTESEITAAAQLVYGDGRHVDALIQQLRRAYL